MPFRDAGLYTITREGLRQGRTTTRSIQVPGAADHLEGARGGRQRPDQRGRRGHGGRCRRGRKLADVNTWVADGTWGEVHPRHGNSWVAMDSMESQLDVAQGAGANFGNLMWALSRG